MLYFLKNFNYTISRNQFSVSNQAAFLLLIFAIISLVGGYKIYQGFAYVSLYFTNPDLVRAIYSESATGLGWLLLKQAYNLAGIALALLFLCQIDKLSIKIILLMLIVVSFFLFSLYGGRWLPLSLALFLFVLTNYFYKPISVRKIFIFIVIIFIVNQGSSNWRTLSYF